MIWYNLKMLSSSYKNKPIRYAFYQQKRQKLLIVSQTVQSLDFLYKTTTNDLCIRNLKKLDIKILL